LQNDVAAEVSVPTVLLKASYLAWLVCDGLDELEHHAQPSNKLFAMLHGPLMVHGGQHRRVDMVLRLKWLTLQPAPTSSARIAWVGGAAPSI